MTTRLLFLLILSSLAGCSTTQMKAFGNHVVGNVVGLVSDVLGDDDASTANAWVPAYQRCDSVCDAKRQATSARLAEEYQRRQRRERKEKTEEAFEEFMEELDTDLYAPASYTPVVIVSDSSLPF